MQAGDPWELGYIDMTYSDETWGQSQVMPRLQYQIETNALARGKLVDGKRVTQAVFVVLDPQPRVAVQEVAQ